MDALFTAFDVSGLSTNVSTVLLVGVTITLLFVGYRFIKKTGKVI